MVGVLGGLFAVSTLAHAGNEFGNPSQTYFQARQATALATAIKKEVPSQPFKDLLLDTARSDDKEFVRTMLIDWKKNSKRNVKSELNALVVRDALGNELMRIVPVAGSPGTFEINGKLWKAPAKGSVAKESTKVVPPACSRCETMVYLSNFLSTPDGADPTKEAKRRLEIFSPAADLISNAGQPSKSELWPFGRHAVEVRCTTDSASGMVNFFGRPHDFSVASDGSVRMKPAGDTSGKSTFKVTLENRLVRYVACADTACEKTSGEKLESAVSLLRWPAKETPLDVAVALNFRARDSAEGIYPIEFACREEVNCRALQIRGLEKMSKRDQEWAVRYRDRANVALMEGRLAQKATYKAEEVSALSLIWGLMPLQACCQQKECVDSVLKAGINLVPSETFQDARTRH